MHPEQQVQPDCCGDFKTTVFKYARLVCVCMHTHAHCSGFLIENNSFELVLHCGGHNLLIILYIFHFCPSFMLDLFEEKWAVLFLQELLKLSSSSLS